jgi:hypothetical protein
MLKLRGALPACSQRAIELNSRKKFLFAFDGNAGISELLIDHGCLLRSDKKLRLTAIFIMAMLLMTML